MRLDTYTEAECEYYRHGCNFTDAEMEVFNLRVKGKSRVQIAEALAISISTADRRLRGIKNKIKKVEAPED